MYYSGKKLHIFRLVCGNVCGSGMETDRTVWQLKGTVYFESGIPECIWHCHGHWREWGVLRIMCRITFSSGMFTDTDVWQLKGMKCFKSRVQECTWQWYDRWWECVTVKGKLVLLEWCAGKCLAIVWPVVEMFDSWSEFVTLKAVSSETCHDRSVYMGKIHEHFIFTVYV